MPRCLKVSILALLLLSSGGCVHLAEDAEATVPTQTCILTFGDCSFDAEDADIDAVEATKTTTKTGSGRKIGQHEY